jgi:hypothetical protein
LKKTVKIPHFRKPLTIAGTEVLVRDYFVTTKHDFLIAIFKVKLLLEQTAPSKKEF